MDPLTVNGVAIDDTFAEAFGMLGTAVNLTGPNRKWAMQAAITMTGFATSVIACGCEAAIDRELLPTETLDGRPGARVLLFAITPELLRTQLQTRIGQCVLTCPGAACYAGMDGGTAIKLGARLRYFGDGWQISKKLGRRHYWRIPVMDGEFLCEAQTGSTDRAVGGGNLIVMARDFARALRACEAAVAAIDRVRDAIMPFPGGIVRSGSKVGSKYKTLIASTNDAYCPTLKGIAATALGPATGAVLEIVIDGLTDDAVRDAMRAGIAAIVALGPKRGAQRIGAGNYGGKLGQFHYRLRELLP